MKKRLIALLLVLALLIPVGVASAATWYRVNTSSLKVRYLPDDSANVLGSYRKDYACTVSSTKDGWSYVTFSNGTEGYVLAKYITKASSYKTERKAMSSPSIFPRPAPIRPGSPRMTLPCGRARTATSMLLPALPKAQRCLFFPMVPNMIMSAPAIWAAAIL